MGETRVDLLHLLEDLRDAYPGTPEETVVTEIVANSLDSGAATITLTADAAARTLVIVDDGRGMRRRELARYHDVAASTKVRGDTIGFAGVGIKIALLISEQVVTETRSGRHHVATTWGLTSRHRAPWKWTPPPGHVVERGTAVRLTLDNGLSPLLDPGYLETLLRRDFEPLLAPALTTFLAVRYPRGVRFTVNGHRLAPETGDTDDTAELGVRLGRQRKPSALGWLSRASTPLAADRVGVAVSTLGKVIKRGWEWLSLTPVGADRLTGLIEVPALAHCLTLNKADFMRGGPHAGVYLAYRKAIQEAVSHQLGVWGDGTEAAEHTRRRVARPVERDLERVLTDLAAGFPLLAALVESRRGGQGRLPGSGGRPGSLPSGVAPGAGAPGTLPTPGGRAAASSAPSSATGDATAVPQARANTKSPATLAATGAAAGPDHDGRRPGRYGLSIDFEHRPDDPEPARLIESTIWINDAHPAYRRAAASRSEGYHLALATALALAPLAVEPAKEHAFLTAFLATWGEAAQSRSGRRRRR